jgi:NAD(P)-dependent dehydrogenase (short-subunit alcohol dehydrogenase family)
VDLGLRDRVYLVTGGTRGLGFAAAEALVAEGARVVISGPHENTASAAAARLSQSAATDAAAAWVVADNGEPDTPDRLVAAAHEHFGRLDGALVSVGGTATGTIATTPDEAWRAAFESVFLGAVRLARVLVADPGPTPEHPAEWPISGTGLSLVFVLASSVRVPLPRLPISNGLFPGLAGVVKTLATELGPEGNWMPSKAIRTRCAPRSLSGFRCVATVSPRNSAGRLRSCSHPPPPSSRVPWSRLTAGPSARSDVPADEVGYGDDPDLRRTAPPVNAGARSSSHCRPDCRPD